MNSVAQENVFKGVQVRVDQSNDFNFKQNCLLQGYTAEGCKILLNHYGSTKQSPKVNYNGGLNFSGLLSLREEKIYQSSPPLFELE